MKGIQYKDTFAVQGSELHKFLSEGKMADAEKSYQATAMREKELMARIRIHVKSHPEETPKC
jgi:hypothetical protein